MSAGWPSQPESITTALTWLRVTGFTGRVVKKSTSTTRAHRAVAIQHGEDGGLTGRCVWPDAVGDRLDEWPEVALQS